MEDNQSSGSSSGGFLNDEIDLIDTYSIPVPTITYRHVALCPMHLEEAQHYNTPKEDTDANDEAIDEAFKGLSTYAHVAQRVNIGSQRLLMSWGGRFDPELCNFTKVQKFDMANKTWLKPVGESLQDPNGSLYYHSLNFNPVNNCLYVLGGVRDDGNNYSLDMLKYNVVEDSWKSFAFSGSSPCSGIYGHVCVYRSVANQLVVFGGLNPTNENDTDIYVLDCATDEWLEPIVPKIPYHSVSFSQAVYSPGLDAMIVYAGEVGEDNTEPYLTCELALFSFKTSSWSVVKFEDTEFSAFPQPLYGHTLCLIDDRFVLTHGGCVQGDRFPKDDCFIFDLTRKEWSSCPELGRKAGKLLCSTLTHDPLEKNLFFYGGTTVGGEIIQVKYKFTKEFFFTERLFKTVCNSKLCDIRINFKDEFYE